MSDVTTVTVLPNGPLMCAGAVKVGDSESDEVFLCRCGRSANKPFCDGSHNANFMDPAELTPDETAGAEQEGGVLAVNPLKNGPLLFSGPFAIASGDGTVVARASKGAMCRCGQSANKPYCDGAHKNCGFVAD